MGSPVTVNTDHNPLVPLFNNPRSKPTARIERWSLRLQPYDVTVVYCTGHDNPADYLSRHTPEVTENSLREERVMEGYINYIATTSTPKSMTVVEINKMQPTEAPIEGTQQQTPPAPAAHQRPQRQGRIPAKLKDYVMK